MFKESRRIYRCKPRSKDFESVFVDFDAVEGVINRRDISTTNFVEEKGSVQAQPSAARASVIIEEGT